MLDRTALAIPRPSIRRIFIGREVQRVGLGTDIQSIASDVPPALRLPNISPNRLTRGGVDRASPRSR